MKSNKQISFSNQEGFPNYLTGHRELGTLTWVTLALGKRPFQFHHGRTWLHKRTLVHVNNFK